MPGKRTSVGGLTITGVTEAMKNTKKSAKLYARATAAALYVEGAEIFAESQQQVPVDTGRLRGSGLMFIEGRAGAGLSMIDAVRVWISYGTDYALAVHEGRTGGGRGGGRGRPSGAAQKPRRRRRRKRMIGPVQQKPKYLSDPFNAAAAGMEQRIAAEVRALVARGGNPLAGKRKIKGKRRG